MSLLLNNAEALVKLQSITKEELVEIFGEMAPIDGNIVGALFNADTDGAKYALLHSNPAGVVAGLKIYQMLTGAKGAVLSVHCDVNEQELRANANMVSLPLEIEIAENVNKMAHRNDFITCICDLVKRAAILLGDTPGALLTVDEDPLQEVKEDTSITDLTGTDIKGVIIDHKFLALSDIEGKKVSEFPSMSGVIHTIKKGQCVVDLMKKEVLTLRKKSCGKCVFCREGLYQVSEIVEAITLGRGKKESADLALEISSAMTMSCNCSLGDTAGLPYLSVSDAFTEELSEHVKNKKCPEEVCAALVQYYVDPVLCRGCNKCADVCPSKCIESRPGYIAMIDAFDCSRCGKCMDVCEYDAIKKTSGRLPKLPDRLTKAKDPVVEAVELEEETTRRTPLKRKRVFGTVGKKVANTEEVVNTEVKKVEVKIVKTIETELVIVAGGPAGLAAAIAAGEKGVKSIIIEKSSTTGGAANMGMGPLGIDTKIQKANFNDISVKEALDMHMEYTHYRVDEDLVQTYFNKSADTIEWLEEMGVEFAGSFRYFKESAATWHIVKPENGVIGPRAAGAMVKAMTERAISLGTEILYETAAQSLVVEDGKVVGAVCVDKNGEGVEVKGKAVVVATGGFGNNKEMVKKEFGLTLGEDFFPFMIPGITGDGLRMMWEVGAQKFMPNIEAIYQLPDNLNWFLLDAVLRQPNLLINQNGDRFMNEGLMGNTTFTGNALALQPGNYGYCIMDGNILKEYKKNGPDIVDIVHPAEAFLAFEGQAAVVVEQNYPAYFEADTVEELAEKLGIDAEKLQDTIDEYNEMCEHGVDTKFHKDQTMLRKITGKGKYLVGKYYLAAYGTVGGVRINKYCEVLDDNMMPIEGLYSAGSDANTIYGDSYNFTLPGNTMGFAVNSGRMAGEAVADYIAEL